MFCRVNKCARVKIIENRSLRLKESDGPALGTNYKYPETHTLMDYSRREVIEVTEREVLSAGEEAGFSIALGAVQS